MLNALWTHDSAVKNPARPDFPFVGPGHHLLEAAHAILYSVDLEGTDLVGKPPGDSAVQSMGSAAQGP